MNSDLMTAAERKTVAKQMFNLLKSSNYVDPPLLSPEEEKRQERRRRRKQRRKGN